MSDEEARDLIGRLRLQASRLEKVQSWAWPIAAPMWEKETKRAIKLMLKAALCIEEEI